MGYKILANHERQFEVIEYPTHAQERAFNRLLVQSADHLVVESEKKRLCDKWGWEPDETMTGEITTRGEYHLELARLIFKDGDELDESAIDNMKPGKVQEARMDFIEGCEGKNDEQAVSSKLVQEMVRSLLGQNEAITETDSNPNTIKP